MTHDTSRASSWTARPDRVFVAAMGHASGKNTMRRHHSLTGSVRRVLFTDDSTGAIDVWWTRAIRIIYGALAHAAHAMGFSAGHGFVRGRTAVIPGAS
jgi:hypothetical protein